MASAGCIWPMGHMFDTPGLESLEKSHMILRKIEERYYVFSPLYAKPLLWNQIQGIALPWLLISYSQMNPSFNHYYHVQYCFTTPGCPPEPVILPTPLKYYDSEHHLPLYKKLWLKHWTCFWTPTYSGFWNLPLISATQRKDFSNISHFHVKLPCCEN